MSAAHMTACMTKCSHCVVYTYIQCIRCTVNMRVYTPIYSVSCAPVFNSSPGGRSCNVDDTVVSDVMLLFSELIPQCTRSAAATSPAAGINTSNLYLPVCSPHSTFALQS
jgi:hypothetical protein